MISYVCLMELKSATKRWREKKFDFYYYKNQIEIKTVGLITGLTDLLFLPFVFIDNESSFPNNLKSSDSG